MPWRSAVELEFGNLEVEFEPAGLASPLFRGLPAVHRTPQWHGAEVRGVPPQTRVLAKSGACATQALGYGDHAFSIQYHVEITHETVSQWARVPAYKRALEDNRVPEPCRGSRPRPPPAMSEFNASARIVYDNFMTMVRGRL